MKKVLAALVMVLGTGSSVVFAQEVNNSSAIVAEAQVPQEKKRKRPHSTKSSSAPKTVRKRKRF